MNKIALLFFLKRSFFRILQKILYQVEHLNNLRNSKDMSSISYDSFSNSLDFLNLKTFLGATSIIYCFKPTIANQ